MTWEEENALRYVAGCVRRKLQTTIKKGSGSGPCNGSGTSGVIVPAPGLFDLSTPCNRFL